MEKANSMGRTTAPFLPRLKQVGMTLVSQRWLALIYGIAIFSCANPLLISNKQHNVLHAILSTQGSAMFIVVGTLACVVLSKYWFTRPEAKLTPGYSEAHLAPLAGAMLLQYFLVPILVFPKMGLDPLGGAALVICLASCLLLSLDKPKLLLFCFLIIGSVSIPDLRNLWLDSDLPFQPQRIICLLVGWWLAVYWLLRHANMDEEAEGYKLPQFALAFGNANRCSRTQQNQLVAKQMSRNRFWTRLSDLALDRLISNKNTSRSQLTGKSFMAGPLPIGVAQAIFFTLIFAVVIQTTLQFFPDAENVAWNMLNQPLMFSLIMPAMMLQQLWSQKKPLMASELLRENGREDYFQSLYFHSLKHTLYGTLAFSLGALILVYAFGERTITPLAISCFITTAIASNSLFASFAIWGSSFRSKLAGISLFIVPFTMGIFAYMAFLLIFRKQFFGPNATNDFTFLNEPSVFLPIYAGSFIAFILSLVILRMSYKKWLRTELG